MIKTKLDRIWNGELLNERDVKEEIDNYMLQFLSAYSTPGKRRVQIDKWRL